MIKLQENLRILMEKDKLSKRALSKRAGLSEGAVKQIFNNESSPQVSTVLKLSNALGVGLEELVFGTPSRGVKGILLDRESFKKSVKAIDELLIENKITLDSEKRAEAYYLWYELDLLDIASSNAQKFETILRMVD